MTSKQRTVIWIGLILITLNLIVKWATVKSIVFNGAGLLSSTTPTKTAPTTTPTTPTPPSTQVNLLLWLRSKAAMTL